MGKLQTITEFQTKLANGGARSNLFEVQIPTLPTTVSGNINKLAEANALEAFGKNPTDEQKKEAAATKVWSGGVGETFKFLCKGAQFPASNIGTVEIPFRGKVLKVGGDRVVDPWTVTIINDEDNSIRKVMEYWMQTMNQYDTAQGISAIDGETIFTDAYIFQLNRGGTATSTNKLPVYKFYDIWPSNISEIALSYDSTDTVEEFTVEFQVHYWEEASGESGVYDKLKLKA